MVLCSQLKIYIIARLLKFNGVCGAVQNHCSLVVCLQVHLQVIGLGRLELTEHTAVGLVGAVAGAVVRLHVLTEHRLVLGLEPAPGAVEEDVLVGPLLVCRQGGLVIEAVLTD